MSLPVPRFQGRAFEKEDKWSWELYVSIFGDDEGTTFTTHLIFDTKEKAVGNLKEAIKEMIRILSEQLPNMGINSNEYIDIKTNETRRWDKKDEH